MVGITISSVRFTILYCEVACAYTNSSKPAPGVSLRPVSLCISQDVQVTKKATFGTPFPLYPYTPGFWPPNLGSGPAVHLALC